MRSRPFLYVPAAVLSFSLLAFSGKQARFPDPAVDVPAGSETGKQSAVLAGGCFWGMEGVFDRVKGVTNVVSGFAGGNKSTAHYETVSTGRTGHAESVQITYNPQQITYGELLKVYFAVAHDPTQLNYQGPDHGTQYRSAIFYTDDEQKKVAEAYIQQLNDAHVFSHKIVTQVVPFTGFYAAESYHQHYLDNHPDQPYIMYNDIPKLEALKKELPQLCKR